LQCGDVDVGAERHARVRVIQQQYLVGGLIRGKFLRGIIDEVTDEKLHPSGCFMVLENVAKRVQKRGLCRAFTSVGVEQNPKRVNDGNGRKTPTNNAVA
jgi:hypothetical protein